ncbi:hypothetical protein B9Z55_027750 [Caenorhabditis nigoni]|uniref:Uncharacterized protein n=1 Tax=Caenorhabditis nigoni TaxID=1611254 RepID=A0A2G5SE24_9PELO|nr:hypothetical protein B9Z55_027750 [Caenorhabditis nigoni]
MNQAMIGGMVHSCIQLLLEIFKDLDSLDFPWYNIHLFILCLMDWTMIKFGWLRVDITMNGEKKIELETLPTVCDNVEQSKEMWNDMKAAPFSPLSNINSCANIH